MHPVDLVIEPRWIVPVEPAGATLEGCAIAIADGRVVAIGPTGTLLERYRPAEHLRRESHVLIPGLVNAHTQAAMTLFRGAPVRGPLMPWLRLTIRPLEARWLSAELVREGTRLAVAEMLRAGITTFADMYSFPEEVIRVAASAHIRPVVGLPVADAPSAWAQSATEYLDKAERLWDTYKSDATTRLYFAPQALWALSADTLERVRRAADQLDAPVVMPVNETQVEVQEIRARQGATPLDWLAELGLLRPGFTAVHLNWLAEGEIELLARSGVSVVHCPQSNLRLGSGICPVPDLLAAGIDVALGTASPASVGALDLLAEARAASLLATGRRAERAPLGAHEALRLATLGGARALGLGDELGSLEPGKAADCVCVDLSSPACQPLASPVEALVFSATRAAVSDVWVAGRAAVSQGRLLGFDEGELAATARGFLERMSAGAAA